MAVACGSAGGQIASPSNDRSPGSAPAGLPAETMPGYVVHRASLTPSSLSADALNPASLDALLGRSGLQSGTETRFTARGKPLTEVIARVLRFGSAAGAEAYLAWVQSHAVDLLGSRTRAAIPPDFPGAIAIRHGPNGCCTKDTLQYFAAWTRGTLALTLLVGGPRAALRSAEPLAQKLDASVL